MIDVIVHKLSQTPYLHEMIYDNAHLLYAMHLILHVNF